jgi:hypothetical protein
VKDPLTEALAPQSLEQWREEREAEKRTADIAAFTAHYLDATDDRVIGRRDERIRKGVELGLLNEQAADELLRTAADAALEAMANGCSGAKAYHDVSDTEFARMVRSATGALDQARAHQLANAANRSSLMSDLRALARGDL